MCCLATVERMCCRRRDESVLLEHPSWCCQCSPAHPAQHHLIAVWGVVVTLQVHPLQAACMNFKWQQALASRVTDLITVVGQTFSYFPDKWSPWLLLTDRNQLHGRTGSFQGGLSRLSARGWDLHSLWPTPFRSHQLAECSGTGYKLRPVMISHAPFFRSCCHCCPYSSSIM